MIFSVNGRLVQEAKASLSSLDSGVLYGDGFYDTLRVYEGVLFELPLHLGRIEKTARAMNIVLRGGTDALTRSLQAVVSRNRLREARVRVTITRGVQGFDFSRAKSPTVLITCMVVRAMSKRGITAWTMPMQRPWPEYKTLGTISLVQGRLEAARLGVDDMIGLSSSGAVLEATTSNVFIVRRGKLCTPKKGILKGLTRSRILRLARSLGIRCTSSTVTKASLMSADEVFLTNRVREIVPVLEVNGRRVGKGSAGPLTKKLQKAYAAYVRTYVQKNQ